MKYVDAHGTEGEYLVPITSCDSGGHNTFLIQISSPIGHAMPSVKTCLCDMDSHNNVSRPHVILFGGLHHAIDRLSIEHDEHAHHAEDRRGRSNSTTKQIGGHVEGRH